MSDETAQLAASEAVGPRHDRWDVGRDACAAALLVIALVLPWNLAFGVGVPNSRGWLFAVAFAVTLLSLAALAATHIGPFSATNRIDKIRLGLNAPYLLVVLGFLGFTLFESVTFGGDGGVPVGIGPGLLIGVAGALLAAQPVPAGQTHHRWLTAAGGVGKCAIVLASLAVLFNLYWRTRNVVPRLFDGSTVGSSAAALATAFAYGAVALIAVTIGLRWLWADEPQARLATIALGASTLVGGVLVWSIPIGREVDAFHGIAQNTSTAAVGFEGYLGWAIAGAIFAPVILRQTLTAKPLDATVWQEALRKCLLLIAFWCSGSAVLRILDVVVALSAGLPATPFENLVLLAFDLVAGGLALWFRRGLTAQSSPPAVISRLCGVLLVLLICRVVVGVGLSPEIRYAAPPEGLADAVYGNTLAHQITSTFDVVLCLLALAMLAAAVFVLGRHRADGGEAEVETLPGPIAERVVPEPEPEPERVAEPEPETEPEPEATASLGRHRHRPRRPATPADPSN